MVKTITDKTLALAGIFQAAQLVQQAARKGTVNKDAFEVCLRSVFQTSPASTEAVYGNIRDIEPGLRLLKNQMGGQTRDMELLKYIIGILHLERQLGKRPDMLQKIGAGIEKAKTMLDHFTYSHDNVVANLAALYTETISTLMPRIIVNGEHGYLANPDIANKVRALLFAAMRSAVLWRQCGGGRWQLFFNRNKMVNEAETLLARAL